MKVMQFQPEKISIRKMSHMQCKTFEHHVRLKKKNHFFWPTLKSVLKPVVSFQHMNGVEDSKVLVINFAFHCFTALRKLLEYFISLYSENKVYRLFI